MSRAKGRKVFLQLPALSGLQGSRKTPGPWSSDGINDKPYVFNLDVATNRRIQRLLRTLPMVRNFHNFAMSWSCHMPLTLR